MHLILGHPADMCCRATQGALLAQGAPVRMISRPFAPPARLVMQIDENGAAPDLRRALALDGAQHMQIDSVLVRTSAIVDEPGWSDHDRAYMQAEISAAMLAWLAGLDCPVINRPTAELWYRHWNPLLLWLPRLRRAGLPVPEMIVTSDVQQVQDFRVRLQDRGLPGAVCTMLTQNVEWLVGPGDWAGLGNLQRYGTITLMEPHHDTHAACIVSGAVIWNGVPGPAIRALEPRMIAFASDAALDFVEIVVAGVSEGWAVVQVDPVPHLEHFDAAAQTRIVDHLTRVLTTAVPQEPILAEVMP